MENQSVFVLTIHHVDEGDTEDPMVFTSKVAAEEYLREWGFCRDLPGEGWFNRGLCSNPDYESFATIRETTVKG